MLTHLVDHNPELELVAGPSEYPAFHEGGAPSTAGCGAGDSGCTRKAASITLCRAVMRLPRRFAPTSPRAALPRIASLAVPDQPRTRRHGVIRAATESIGRMARDSRRAIVAGIHAPIGDHLFRATGITAYFANGGALEHARRWRRTGARARPSPMTPHEGAAHTGRGRTDQAMIFLSHNALCMRRPERNDTKS